MKPGNSLSSDRPIAASYPGAPANVSSRRLHEILLWVNILRTEVRMNRTLLFFAMSYLVPHQVVLHLALLADSAFPVPCIGADRPALVFITILIVDILG